MVVGLVLHVVILQCTVDNISIVKDIGTGNLKLANLIAYQYKSRAMSEFLSFVKYSIFLPSFV